MVKCGATSTVAYDKNDEAILQLPTLSEVISEGEELLTDLEQVLNEMENTKFQS